MEFLLKTPEETSKDLSRRLKELRLIKKWKRSTLSKRSGVTQSSLRRFEQTGKASMENFLKLIHALGRLDEAESLLQPPTAQSFEELKREEQTISKRGTI
ncbi:MAG: helix-turn-helix transcriptional regulator [Thermodesulfobacteriota bacterium]|nr:helix-turn-helix transcriptional regulator [Thermodesulfobacteriota bacterium]